MSDNNNLILVVEDNIVNQYYLTALLGIWKINFKVANNGQEALDAILKDKYDCILMDIFMPVMDGIEATILIRKDPEYDNFKNIPIIAVTASFMHEDMQACLNAGMNDIITKPIDENKLYKVLTTILNNR